MCGTTGILDTRGERLDLTGWFARGYLTHLVNAHQSGRSDHSTPLWTLLMFEAFLRKVVDGDGSPGGYTFRTLALLRERRRLGWETFHLTSPEHSLPCGPEETVEGGHFFRTPAPTGARLPGLTECALKKTTPQRLLEGMPLTELVTPLKPLVAIAQGWLLVASGIGGHQELIRDSETGVLFEAGSAKALPAAVLGLLAQRERWPARRVAGREFVETERTWARSAAHYRPVFEYPCQPAPAHAA